MDSRLYRGLMIVALWMISQFSWSQNVVYFGNEVGMTSMTNAKIQRVFTGKETLWKNGKTVVICLPGTKSAKAQEVYTKVYNKSVKEVQKFWLSLVFQGRAKSPVFFDSEQEMVDYVKRTPGAIGVFTADKKSLIPSGQLITVVN
jgi:ABC-type phosphate transport system substrate-binding protein